MHDQCSRYCRDIQTRIENKAANVLELKDSGGKMERDHKVAYSTIVSLCRIKRSRPMILIVTKQLVYLWVVFSFFEAQYLEWLIVTQHDVETL